MLLVAGVYGWSTGFREVDFRTLGWLAALAIPSEILDQLLGFWAARRYGVSWTGLLGGFIGGMIGAGLMGSALPLVGVVLGALLGGFAGAYLCRICRPAGRGGRTPRGVGQLPGTDRRDCPQNGSRTGHGNARLTRAIYEIPHWVFHPTTAWEREAGR